MLRGEKWEAGKKGVGDGEAHSIVPSPIPPAKLLPGHQYSFSREAVPYYSALVGLTKTRPIGSTLNAKCTFSKRAIFTFKKEETNTGPCLLNAKTTFSKRLVNAKKMFSVLPCGPNL